MKTQPAKEQIGVYAMLARHRGDRRTEPSGLLHDRTLDLIRKAN
jgi:hypothetical protein